MTKRSLTNKHLITTPSERRPSITFSSISFPVDIALAGRSKNLNCNVYLAVFFNLFTLLVWRRVSITTQSRFSGSTSPFSFSILGFTNVVAMNTINLTRFSFYKLTFISNTRLRFGSLLIAIL